MRRKRQDVVVIGRGKRGGKDMARGSVFGKESGAYKSYGEKKVDARHSALPHGVMRMDESLRSRRKRKKLLKFIERRREPGDGSEYERKCKTRRQFFLERKN